jgi:Ca2+-binding EF-hand superfamily protein
MMMRTTGEGEALTDTEFETLFQKVDKDASGVISFDEYYA